MLPTTHKESLEQQSQRQANFIVWRSLESQLPVDLFTQVLSKVSSQIEFPQRLDWEGHQKDLTFGELKTNFSHIDQNYLPQLLQQSTNGANNQHKKKDHLKNQINSELSIKKRLVTGSHQNIALTLRHRNLNQLSHLQKQNIHAQNISRFERVKTVCGHAAIDNGDMTGIYNVIFDREGKFIISGADDGILKIWDKDTLTLQASLHGHKDVITDVDISKCNRYLASASKDGQVFIWDFQKCIIIDKLPTHSNSVNNIKFFQFSQKEESKSNNKSIQLLVTCSEDGTIRVYDEKAFSQNAHQEEGQQQPRRTGRSESIQPKKNRFYVTLTPDEFRPGSRNKKIESLTMNEQGLLVGGTNYGDILLWKLDYAQFQRQQVKPYTYLGCFKKHSKDVHFTEFSPNGNLLLTGSIDGTAKVWNMEEEKVKKDSSAVQKPFWFTEDKVRVVFEEKRRNPQCDCLTWSVHGRYAIVSISGKTEGENCKDVSIIKVWDSYSDTMIADLAKHNDIQLSTFSFVLAAHPKYEEILLTGSEGGQIILWNLQTMKTIKKFIEYGIYSLDKYTFNDPYDGKFSPDGACFVVGSQNGTLSLFSNEGVAHKYAATRVEQFLIDDGCMHEENIYDKYDYQPQICNSTLVPYEVQPPSNQIGKFKGRNKLSPQDYQRQYVERVEKSKEEEEFIQTQLEEGLRNNFFNNHLEEDLNPNLVQLIDDFQEEEEDEELVVVRRNHAGRPRIVSDAINRNNQNGQNRGGRRNLQTELMEQVVQQINARPNYDPNHSEYDRDSDVDFEIEENESDNDEQSKGTDLDNQSEYIMRGKRENYHQLQRNNREAQQKDYTEIYIQSQEDYKRLQEQSRSERAKRRQQLKGNSDEIEESASEGEETQHVIKTRNQRKRIIGDMDSDSDQDLKGTVERNTRRRLVKNNEGGRNRQKEGPKLLYDLKSSEDDSVPSEEEEESFIQEKKKPQIVKQVKNGRNSSVNTRYNGKAKVNYANMDDSDSDEQMLDVQEEEEKQEEVIVPKKNARLVNIDKEEEDQIIQINTASTISKQRKTVYDEDYELVEVVPQQQAPLEEDVMENHNETKVCALCQRSDAPLAGPFCKFSKSRAVIDGPHYFHKDCIEINLFSLFDKVKGKWINIGKALEMLVRKKKYKCIRCNTSGATIQCSSCFQFYHGFLCSQTYQIWLGGESYQCYDCRNKFNFKQFQDKAAISEEQYLEICKKIPRDYLLTDKVSLQNYFPQLNDTVYYFFQGHEKFITTYNCFFYCGDLEHLSFNYPWRKYPELTKPTLCRIKNISFGFPSPQAIYLIKKYGKSSNDISQVPHIITQLELEIVGQTNKQFHLDMFPHELPEFLVLKNIYENSYARFQEMCQADQIVDHVFTTTCRNFIKVKVTKVQPKESLFPNSEWETVLFQHQEAYGFRNRQGRRGHKRNEDELNHQPPGIMNFWELNLNDYSEDLLQNQMQAFDCIERERIENVVNSFNVKKGERIIPFLERVSELVAPDYRCHVPTESFLVLVLQRLKNNYYRSQEQLFFDLDMISYNAKIYNGELEFLSLEAKKLMEKLRCEIKKHINAAGDKVNKKEETKLSLNDIPIKIPGKLTAPPMINGRNYLQQPSSMDKFLKESEDVNVQQQNNICRQRAQVEESKSKEKIKRSGQRNKEQDEQESESENEYNCYVIPKTNNNNGGGAGEQQNERKQRRLIRNQQSETGSIQLSSTSHQNGNNQATQEKQGLSKAFEQQEEKIEGLGKRQTRSNKQKPTGLNESIGNDKMEQDEEVDQELENVTRSRYPKRFKQQ